MYGNVPKYAIYNLFLNKYMEYLKLSNLMIFQVDHYVITERDIKLTCQQAKTCNLATPHASRSEVN